MTGAGLGRGRDTTSVSIIQKPQTTMAKHGRTLQPILFLWMVSMGSSLVTIPLVPHKVVRQRKLSAGEPLPPKMERPHYSKYDQRFLQHEVSAEQVAGLYQGYGTVGGVVVDAIVFLTDLLLLDSSCSIMPICGVGVRRPNGRR